MGQYHYVVNPRKRQYLYPHRFGQGLKLMEFSGAGDSIMQATALLLADSNGRGGGDFHCEDKPDADLVGHWAGDPVVLTGDYGDAGQWLDAVPDLEKLMAEKPVRIGDIWSEAWLKAQGLDPNAVCTPEHAGTCELNLYFVADQWFEDISERMIKLVVSVEGTYSDLKWLTVSEDGVSSFDKPLALRLTENLASTAFTLGRYVGEIQPDKPELAEQLKPLIDALDEVHRLMKEGGK